MLLRGEFWPNIISKKIRNSTAKKARRLCRWETNSTAMMWNGRCLNKPHIWARTGQTSSTAVLLSINTVSVHQLYMSLIFFWLWHMLIPHKSMMKSCERCLHKISCNCSLRILRHMLVIKFS